VVVPRHGIGQRVAAFAFVDGHSRAATPEEAEAFQWEASEASR
jgi:prepilin-type processing-associated H-X9-DG protein